MILFIPSLFACCILLSLLGKLFLESLRIPASKLLDQLITHELLPQTF